MKRFSICLLLAISIHLFGALFFLFYQREGNQNIVVPPSMRVGLISIEMPSRAHSKNALVSSAIGEKEKPTPESSPTIAVPLGNFALEYPAMSRELGEEGSVFLSLIVNKLGKAKDITITNSSGFLRLDQAAIHAAEKAFFLADTNNSALLTKKKTLQVRFELRQSSR